MIATNRGRSPARVMSTADESRIAKDETQLPGIPEYTPVDPDVPPVTMILLPGEFATIKSFCRDDVNGLSGSADAIAADRELGRADLSLREGDLQRT